MADPLPLPEWKPRKWAHCPTHGPEERTAWGCPHCVSELRAQVKEARRAALLEAAELVRNYSTAGGVVVFRTEVVNALKERANG